ncbi:hypothetical protein F4819DRAFT_455197 [Hypoxylon fuscum]|nr:hypothetical protein F4819DRAFT_455197 [Hypoxylon fuscum]
MTKKNQALEAMRQSQALQSQTPETMNQALETMKQKQRYVLETMKESQALERAMQNRALEMTKQDQALERTKEEMKQRQALLQSWTPETMKEATKQSQALLQSQTMKTMNQALETMKQKQRQALEMTKQDQALERTKEAMKQRQALLQSWTPETMKEATKQSQALLQSWTPETMKQLSTNKLKPPRKSTNTTPNATPRTVARINELAKVNQSMPINHPAPQFGASMPQGFPIEQNPLHHDFNSNYVVSMPHREPHPLTNNLSSSSNLPLTAPVPLQRVLKSTQCATPPTRGRPRKSNNPNGLPNSPTSNEGICLVCKSKHPPNKSCVDLNSEISLRIAIDSLRTGGDQPNIQAYRDLLTKQLRQLTGR